MSRIFNGRSFQFAAILLAAFLILIVNREFGVADNGDFYRYMGDYTSKPVGGSDTQPAAQTPEWKVRFFQQPVIYWAPEIPGANPPWFSSALLFWSVGDTLGELFYSPNVFNMRYVGLPFFLIHFLALFYLFRRLSVSAAGPALMLAGAFWMMSDARLTAFYNSFYAESVVILALTLLFALLAGRAFGREPGPTGPVGRRVLPVIVLLVLLAAVFAKRQYLYFVGPVLLFAFYFLWEEIRLGGKLKMALLCGFAAGLLGLVAVTTSSQRAGNPAELNASRITSYHALYFGLLPHSKNPVALMEKLGLPEDSKRLIGKSAWNPESQKLIAEQPNIEIKTFLRAVALEPAAFARSILRNAREVGNFAIPLGMTPGAFPGHPPVLVSSFSALFTKLAGAGMFWTAIIVAMALVVFPVGVASERRFSSRILALILLTIVMADVVISTFDGQQEARKHVLVASIAASLIVIHGLASLAGLVLRRRQRS